MHKLLELADCDVGVVPTQWQRQQFPPHLSSKLQVIHEGIDEMLSSTGSRDPSKT